MRLVCPDCGGVREFGDKEDKRESVLLCSECTAKIAQEEAEPVLHKLTTGQRRQHHGKQ